MLNLSFLKRQLFLNKVSKSIRCPSASQPGRRHKVCLFVSRPDCLVVRDISAVEKFQRKHSFLKDRASSNQFAVPHYPDSVKGSTSSFLRGSVRYGSINVRGCIVLRFGPLRHHPVLLKYVATRMRLKVKKKKSN